MSYFHATINHNTIFMINKHSQVIMLFYSIFTHTSSCHFLLYLQCYAFKWFQHLFSYNLSITEDNCYFYACHDFLLVQGKYFYPYWNILYFSHEKITNNIFTIHFYHTFDSLIPFTYFDYKFNHLVYSFYA